MSRPIRVWQGTDKTVFVDHDFANLVSATELNVYIDSCPQIVKSLGDGITNVTADSYILTIAAEDTEQVESGEYDIQARITTSGGDRRFGRIIPGQVKVLDSVFTDTE